MDRLAKRIADKRVLMLIRRYLQAGIMGGGVVRDQLEGTPQGSPLSPLQANVLLDEVDKELERRGHKFVRYADNSNVYVRSRWAGERVLQSLKRLYAKLHLKVNESKTAVGPAFGRKFLGYCFRRWSNNTVKIAVAPKALETFRHRIREIGWSKPGTGGWATKAVSAGMEVLLTSGSNAKDVQRPRFVDSPPTSGGSAQALETRPNGVP